MTAPTFKEMIREVAERLPRHLLEQVFCELYEPAEPITQNELDELVHDFSEEYCDYID